MGGGEIRDRFWLREEKRGKRNEVVINRSIREALELYRETYEGIADFRQLRFFQHQDE